MRKVFFFFLLVFTALFTLLSEKIDSPPGIKFLQNFDLGSGESTPTPPEMGSSLPFNGLYLESNHTVLFPEGRRIKLEEKDLVSVPFQGDGYITYEKVGKEIVFHSRLGELFWRREYSSYPVFDHYGQLILLLTGDGNRVDLIDKNGNPAQQRSLSGNFMVDWDFATRTTHTAVAFADGSLFLLSPRGELLFKAQVPGEGLETPPFVKSCAISPDGGTVAVHYGTPRKDFIVTYSRKGEEGKDASYRMKGPHPLKVSYSHLIHFSVSEEGELLIAAPEETTFLSEDGEVLWERPLDQHSSIYRPVFADRNYFLFGEGEWFYLVDREGRIVSRHQLEGAGNRWRVLPGSGPGEFAIQSGDFLRFYRVIPWNRPEEEREFL